MERRLGYCTNVHAGADLAQTRANLEKHALAVKARFSPNAPMGIGLWLSAPTARTLIDTDGVAGFRDWLADHGLIPFTLNGFPHGDFHQPVVKHRVYEPTWAEPERLAYTRDLVHILHAILPAGEAGSISTLPLGWADRPAFDACASHLSQLADDLHRLEQDTGRRITLGLEPEPGCALDTADDVVDFFKRHLLPAGDEKRIRRHIGVCHDVCHSVVMFEPQVDALAQYRQAGLTLSKVQVSSAVTVDFATLDTEQRAAALRQLRDFDEKRYLHQTSVREPNNRIAFYEDLPAALDAVDDPAALKSAWAIHFHVPVYLERFGLLGTSRAAVIECLQQIDAHRDTQHFEVETYAWNVLPDELKQAELADGIAEELKWFAGVCEHLGPV